MQWAEARYDILVNLLQSDNQPYTSEELAGQVLAEQVQFDLSMLFET